MIQLHFTGHNFDADEKIKKYVSDKIGNIDKYLPKASKNHKGTVVLTEDPSGREDNQYIFEAILAVPGNDLIAKEAAINMYAAVDIVTAKLKSQARRYKQKNGRRPNKAKMIMRRFLRMEEEAA